MGDLRTNIHSLSKRKLEAVHILLLNADPGHKYGDGIVIVIEANIWRTQDKKVGLQSEKTDLGLGC